MNPAIIRHLKADPVLSEAISRASFDINEPSISLYEHLTRSIVSQQLSVKAAATIYGRFRALFPVDHLLPEMVLKKNTDVLRSVGLSQQKSGYLHNISAYFIEHDLMQNDWKQWSDEKIIEILLPIKGVGVWTIQMILIFHLLRDDVFPIDDLAIRERMLSWYNPQGEGKERIRKLHEIAESWRPYRSWACRYIWAAGDLQPM